MRLRLNTTLRAALIAAITAVGFTLTQAQAAVPYTGSVYTWDNTTSGTDPAFGKYALTTYDEQGKPTVTGTVISGQKGNWGDVQAIFASDNIQTGNTMRFDSTHGQNVKALYYTFTPFTVGGIIVEEGAADFSINSSGSYDRAFFLGNKDGSASYTEIHENFAINKTTGSNTLTLRGAETFNVAAGKTFTLKSNNTIAMSGSLNVTGGGTVSFAQGNVAMDNGFTLAIQENATLSFAGAVSGLSHTITNAGTLTFASDTVTLGTDLSGFDDFAATYEDYTGVQANNGFVGAVACSIIKNTGAGQSNLSKVVYGGNTYNLDDNGKVVIGDGINYTTYYLNTDGATVDLAQAITRSSSTLTTVEVKGETGTITVNSNSTLGSLSIASGSTATVNGTAELTLNGLTGAGALNIAAGTTTLGSGITNAFSGTVSVANATLNTGSNRQNISTLTIGDGGVVNATGADNANGCISGDIDIKAGGTFKVTGHHDAFGWGGNATKNIILTGESGKLATLELNQTTTNSATMKTNIAMHGYSKITSTNDSKGFNTYGGSIFAENTNNTIDKMQLRSDATIEVKSAGALSVGNMIYGQDGTHNLTKAGEGTLTFTGTANMNSLTLNGGSVVFNGTSSIANGLTQAEGKSITVGGSLTLGGNVTFGHQAINVTAGGSITKGANLVFNLDGLTAAESSGTYTYTLFSGAAVDLVTMGLTTDNITIDGGTGGKTWTFGTNGTISYTVSSSKIWTGDEGAGNWNYTEANWNGQKFEEGDIAEFRDYAGVVVNAAVQAGGILVGEGSMVYLTNSEETPGTLSAASIDIAADAMLSSEISIDGVQSYSVGQDAWWAIGADQTLGAGTNNGTIFVVEGVTVTKTGTSAASDLSGFANDGGTLSVALADATGGDDNIVTMLEVGEEIPSSGTFELRSGTIDYRSDLGDQTLKLNNGTRLLFGNAGDTHEYAGDIEVAGNASVLSHGTSKHSQVTISGDVTGEGTLTRENDGNQALNFTGTVSLGGYTNNDAQDNNVTDFQGATTLGTLTVGNKSKTKFSNANTTIDTITVNGSGTVEFANSITLSGLTSTGNHDLTLNATNGALVTIAGANKSLYKLVTAGDIVIAEGTTLSLGNNLTPNSGTVIVNGTVNVGHEIDLSNGKTSTGKLIVGTTGRVTSTDGMWMHLGTAIEMKNGGQFTTKGLTFTGTGDTSKITYGGAAGTDTNYGVEKAEFVITDTAITANQAATIGNKLVNSSVNTGAYAVTVNNANNTIAGATVGEGGSLSMTEGTLFSVIESSGSVTLTGTTLDKESFIEQGGETGSHYDLNGQLTDGDNYYLGTSEKYLTVVNGGTSATGTNLTWGDATGLTMTDGKVVTEAGEVVYETFYVNADSVNVSDILANDTTAVQVNAGTLVVNQDATGVNITVTEFGTISGDYANAEQVGIASEALAQYTQDVEVSGVKFTPADVTDAVLIYNAGEQTKVYGTDDSNMSVSAKKLEMTKQDGDVTVSNAVYVDEIVNTTTHALTLNNVENTLELVNMDITNSTVKVYTDLVQDTEATVSISGVLEAGGGTLLANLTLVDDSTLDLSLVGGGMQAITLGSTLTFDLTQGGLVNLDQDTINALAGLNEGEWLDLIVAADGTQLGYVGAQTGMSYDQLFNAEGLTGPYTVYANEGSFGLVKGSQVPEPTTGTLSLLALAALAARRRRK